MQLLEVHDFATKRSFFVCKWKIVDPTINQIALQWVPIDDHKSFQILQGELNIYKMASMQARSRWLYWMYATH